MSLSICPDCRGTVSSNAQHCPHCGRVIKRRTHPLTWLIAIVLIPIVLIAVADRGKGGSDALKNPVKAQVETSTTKLFVRNQDSFAWPQMKVYLNGTPLAGYRYERDAPVAPDEQVEIPLSDFATPGGERFDPAAKTVRQTMVWVPGHDAPIQGFR